MALADSGQAGALELRTEESFREKVDHFATGIRHIGQRWDNWLLLQNLTLWEKCLQRDWAFLLIFDRPSSSIERAPQIVERCVLEVNFHAGRFKHQIGHIVHPQSGDEDVVLVDVIVARDGPDEPVAVPITVRAHIFKHEPLNIGEGVLYKRLFKSIYEVFPRFVERKIEFGGGVLSACKCTPQMVVSGSQVVHRITDDERDHSSFRASACEAEFNLAVGAMRKGKSLLLALPKRLDNGFEFVDVAVGPLDL